MSQILSVIFHMKVPVEIYIPNFFLDFFYFSFLSYNVFKQKKSLLLKSGKIHINLINYQNFLAILEDRGFKTAGLKKKLLKCILYIEINKKIRHKTVR